MRWFIGLIFVASLAQANELCSLGPQRDVVAHKLSKIPNYFFKTSADGRYVYFIADDKNWMLDTKNGAMKSIPGTADPVPSSDGELMTYLERTSGGWNILTAPMQSGVPTNAAKISGRISGSYQSVGNKRADGSYSFMYYGLPDDVIVQDLIKGPQGYALAPRRYDIPANGKLRLPMMSPDGKRFSALNTATNKTEIYDLLDNPPRAKLVKALPYAGGKASFSYDSKKITFHMTRTIQAFDAYPEYSYLPTLDDARQVRDVYVYDLETDVVQQVTSNKNGNSYYPVFLQDGRVAYIHKPTNDSAFQIQYSTIPQGPQRSFDDVMGCFGADPSNVLKNLFDRWAKICQVATSADVNNLGVAKMLNLSDENCAKLAQQSNDANLVKLCQAMKGANQVRVAPADDSPGAKILNTRCLICHADKDAAWFKANYAKVEKSIRSTNPQTRMPKGGAALSATDIKDLLDYLKKTK